MYYEVLKEIGKKPASSSNDSAKKVRLCPKCQKPVPPAFQKMVQGFVDGDEAVIKDVNKKATQSAIFLVVMIVLIVLMFWALITFGKYLISFF